MYQDVLWLVNRSNFFKQPGWQVATLSFMRLTYPGWICTGASETGRDLYQDVL
jgi:hypothetical protein